MRNIDGKKRNFLENPVFSWSWKRKKKQFSLVNVDSLISQKTALIFLVKYHSKIRRSAGALVFLVKYHSKRRRSAGALVFLVNHHSKRRRSAGALIFLVNHHSKRRCSAGALFFLVKRPTNPGKYCPTRLTTAGICRTNSFLCTSYM